MWGLISKRVICTQNFRLAEVTIRTYRVQQRVSQQGVESRFLDVCYFGQLQQGLEVNRKICIYTTTTTTTIITNTTTTSSSSTTRGTRWRTWLRHCAKIRKVAGSISDGVIENFHWHTPSSRTVAVESIQPLTEMSTRNISWGWRAENFTTFMCRLSQPPGNLWVSNRPV